MEELSLLDWINAKLSEPRTRRRVYFGLGSLAALGGAVLLFQGGLFTGLAGIVLGAWLGWLGLQAPVDGPVVPWPTRTAPAVSLPEAAAAEPAAGAGRVGAPAISAGQWLQAARLPLVVLGAVAGQWILTYQRDNWVWGLLFYACALLPFVWLLWREGWLEPARAAVGEVKLDARTTRWGLLALAGLSGAYAFLSFGGNTFRADGVLMWAVSTLAWGAAVWEWQPGLARLREQTESFWRRRSITLQFSGALLVLLLALGVGAYFRYARLEAIPPEMTSDHVEKLLDVGDVLAGQFHIFFERNTGREAMQFYVAALTDRLLGTGLTHLTLKIGTATFGFLLLPFIFWLGRELEDDWLGALAALLAAFSFWATAISRVGLRFPLSPAFAAPVLLFLLRGLRRGSRNDFLLAGLFLGLGLHGYSTFRIMPPLVALGVGWFALWPQARGQRRQLALHLLLLAVTAFLVFLPLARYSLDNPEMFWYRTLSRVGDAEAGIVGDRLAVFLANQWDVLRMFNWLGDEVWVNTLPGQPALDFISGALLVVGAVYLLARLALRRDARAGFLLLVGYGLLLPSSLNLAFPQENPSVVRTSGAIPIVFLVAAYPLWLLLRQARRALPPLAALGGAGRSGGQVAGGGLAALLLVGALSLNHTFYFVRYPPQYTLSAQNASELGQVIHDFAHSIGSYETAWVRPYPYWVDTRAVGMYAGNFGWDAAIQLADLGRLQSDPRPRLFITHRWDQESLAELRRLYPTGTLSVVKSRVPDHDFLVYFVPGTLDVDERMLPQAPQ